MIREAMRDRSGVREDGGDDMMGTVSMAGLLLYCTECDYSIESSAGLAASAIGFVCALPPSDEAGGTNKKEKII